MTSLTVKDGTVTDINPGDILLVHRRSTPWQWMRRPFASLISWRIRRNTNGWANHTACYIGNWTLIEAEWDRGVTYTRISEYTKSSLYDCEVARLPSGLDAKKAVAAWKRSFQLGSYDTKHILMYRLTTALYGAEDAVNRLRSKIDDNWICSELSAYGWKEAGYKAWESLMSPKDFEKHAQSGGGK